MSGVAIKPILKWAGGKSQLLDEITSHFPEYVYKQDFCLVEPFVGGGGGFFLGIVKPIISQKTYHQ